MFRGYCKTGRILDQGWAGAGGGNSTSAIDTIFLVTNNATTTSTTDGEFAVGWYKVCFSDTFTLS